MVKSGGVWGKYMKANKNIRAGVINIVFPIARKIKRGASKYIRIVTNMVIENGESINGYQFLHGTNKKVGGFQIYGKISKNRKGTVTYRLTYVWNDIIDPNYLYDTDKFKVKIAKKIANPKDYIIKIILSDVSIVYSNGRKGKGWLGK